LTRKTRGDRDKPLSRGDWGGEEERFIEIERERERVSDKGGEEKERDVVVGEKKRRLCINERDAISKNVMSTPSSLRIYLIVILLSRAGTRISWENDPTISTHRGDY